MNIYFDLPEPEPLTDIEALLSLNVKKTYYSPGDTTEPLNRLSSYAFPYKTAGIFRGQIHDFPLVPKCFRDTRLSHEELSEVVLSLRWHQATRTFSDFCDRAEAQNPTFPANVSDRMSIAQHFGVPTPLLDWSRNIFTALFFAIREVFSDSSFEHSLKVFVYHVRDERLLHDGVPDTTELYEFGHSAFVEPYPIDRRIERQRGVFTFHPYPAVNPPKIPAHVYVLEWPIIWRLIELMQGFGFTEDYFFPDYAGIADGVMSGTSL